MLPSCYVLQTGRRLQSNCPAFTPLLHIPRSYPFGAAITLCNSFCSCYACPMRVYTPLVSGLCLLTWLLPHIHIYMYISALLRFQLNFHNFKYQLFFSKKKYISLSPCISVVKRHFKGDYNSTLRGLQHPPSYYHILPIYHPTTRSLQQTAN